MICTGSAVHDDVTDFTSHPKPSAVRNVEVNWLLAVDELAASLEGLEKPLLSKGRAFLNSARGD
jgi:hypothetical protein